MISSSSVIGLRRLLYFPWWYFGATLTAPPSTVSVKDFPSKLLGFPNRSQSPFSTQIKTLAQGILSIFVSFSIVTGGIIDYGAFEKMGSWKQPLLSTNFVSCALWQGESTSASKNSGKYVNPIVACPVVDQSIVSSSMIRIKVGSKF